MTLGPLLPLLSLFFVFIYKYSELLKVSKNVKNSLKNDAEVSDIRDSEPSIFIHADNDCLYNHDNLCQKMNYID